MLSSDRSTMRQPRKWTFAEDQILREEVESQMLEGEVKDWCRIAAKLNGRTNKDCRKRWFNSVAGGLKKGQWAKSEDVLLAKGVQKFGQRWTLVADVVGSRSADQCAKRWQQSLDPELDHSEWKDGEDTVLIQAVQRLGRHWKDIQQQHFPGRSKNCIKNRYTVLLRRYQNQPYSSSMRATESPELIPASGSSSVYGEDDSDTQSYHGSYGFNGAVSLAGSPLPLPASFADWDAQNALGLSQPYSSPSLPPPNFTSSGYWAGADACLPAASALSSQPSYMDFELSPASLQAPSSYPEPTSYALGGPMFAPTSAPTHRRAYSGINSHPGSPALRAITSGNHTRRPRSAIYGYTSHPPDQQSMASYIANARFDMV